MYLNYFSSKPISFPLNLFEVSKFCESLTKAMDLSSRKIHVLKNYKKYMCIIVIYLLWYILCMQCKVLHPISWDEQIEWRNPYAPIGVPPGEESRLNSVFHSP